MAVTIAYSAPTITLTGVGTATLQDIVDADGVGGWGVSTAYGNGFFQILAHITVGNGSDATVLTIQQGEALDMTGYQPQVTANAIMNWGEPSNDYGKGPVFIKLAARGWQYPILVSGATLNSWCASIVWENANHLFMSQAAGATLNMFRTTVSGTALYWVAFKYLTADIEDYYSYRAVIAVTAGTNTWKNIAVEAGTGIGFSLSFADGEIDDVLITNATQNDVATGTAHTLTVKNPRWIMTQGKVKNVDASGEIHYVNTVDIHKADKDGANLETAQIVCDGSSNGSNYDTEQFDVNTVADGTITQQDALIKKWVGTSETETDYNVHRFTASKAGKKTLVLENKTIAGAIDWHSELQTIEMPPSAVQYG